jgi:adenosylcobinamide-phosphate synthase
LGVCLGGANNYGGRVEVRPWLGAIGRAPEVADIGRAVRLSRAVTTVVLAGAVLLARRRS